MIISHRHRFIFLHAPKMAGSAIKLSLLPYLGRDDLILGALDDAIMQGLRPNRATLRHVLHPHSAAWFRQLLTLPFTGRKGLAGFVNWANGRHFREVYGLVTHSGAQECQRAFPREFSEYERIAVTRNPWDYFVSAYFWRYRRLPVADRPSFEQFVDAVYFNRSEFRGADFRRKLGARFYFMDDGSPALTDVIRFNDLANEWDRVRRKLGLPEQARLASAKTHTREGRPYREQYTAKTRDMVAELCAQEIHHFHHEF